MPSQVGSTQTGFYPKEGGLIACPHLDAPGILFVGSPSPWEMIHIDRNQYRSICIAMYTWNKPKTGTEGSRTQNSPINMSLLSHVGAHRDLQTRRDRSLTPVQSTPRHCSLKSLSKQRGVLSNLRASSAEANICILQRTTGSRPRKLRSICFPPFEVSPK